MHTHTAIVIRNDTICIKLINFSSELLFFSKIMKLFSAVFFLIFNGEMIKFLTNFFLTHSFPKLLPPVEQKPEVEEMKEKNFR